MIALLKAADLIVARSVENRSAAASIKTLFRVCRDQECFEPSS
jgi:hypothetical protein